MNNLVGDISSAARALPSLDGEKIFIQKGKGAHVWDTNGKRYIDTALGFGTLVIGHAHEELTAAVIPALQASPTPAWPHLLEQQAAAALCAHTRDLSKAIFCTTGSEAVHLACRAAKAHTGKTTIAKIAAGYDGWFDDVTFGNAATQEALFTDQRPNKDAITLLRYNDFDDVEKLFSENSDIAAILVEPLLANAACIQPLPGYLEHLKQVAHKHGALVIADEVATGFRLHAGLSSHAQEFYPDIAAIGKSMGGGIAVSAVVSTPEIMEGFETGKVVRAGTFSGNPVACAAVIATMAILDKSDYPALLERGERLKKSIVKSFADNGIAVSTAGYGNLFGIWPAAHSSSTYPEAAKIFNAEFSMALHVELRKAGVLITPSSLGRLYLSFEHDDAVIADMEQAFALAAKAIAKAL